MKKNTVKLNENTLKRIIVESVKKVLNESWGSKKLRALCKEHGKILVNHVPSGVLANLQEMTDEELVSAWKRAMGAEYNPNIQLIPFEDGFTLKLLISNENEKNIERQYKNIEVNSGRREKSSGYNKHHDRDVK